MGHSGSLFIPNYSPSLSSMDLGPSLDGSGLEKKNGLGWVSLPVDVHSLWSCCSGLKVRNFLGKASSGSLLEMALDCSPSLGISFDGSKDQFSGLLADILNCPDSAEKKEKGASPKMRNKGTRELSRLFCSVNYEPQSGSTAGGRRRGRGYKSLF